MDSNHVSSLQNHTQRSFFLYCTYRYFKTFTESFLDIARKNEKKTNKSGCVAEDMSSKTGAFTRVFRPLLCNKGSLLFRALCRVNGTMKHEDVLNIDEDTSITRFEFNHKDVVKVFASIVSNVKAARARSTTVLGISQDAQIEYCTFKQYANGCGSPTQLHFESDSCGLQLLVNGREVCAISSVKHKSKDQGVQEAAAVVRNKFREQSNNIEVTTLEELQHGDVTKVVVTGVYILPKTPGKYRERDLVLMRIKPHTVDLQVGLKDGKPEIKRFFTTTEVSAEYNCIRKQFFVHIPFKVVRNGINQSWKSWQHDVRITHSLSSLSLCICTCVYRARMFVRRKKIKRRETRCPAMYITKSFLQKDKNLEHNLRILCWNQTFRCDMLCV